jgi:hypothetical protein
LFHHGRIEERTEVAYLLLGPR